ncbi:hypothetical protein CsSME_00007374 [Camellia sinensis var. sinensis]
MAMEDNETCDSRVVDSLSLLSKTNRQDRQRLEVFNKVLIQIQHLNHQDANLPRSWARREGLGVKERRDGPKKREKRGRGGRPIGNRWGE